MKNTLNDMVRIERDGKCAWVTIPQGRGQEFVECAAALNNSLAFKLYSVGRMPFADLPDAVQDEVRDTLTLYPVCNVEFENGRFIASPSTCIRSSYPDDAFSCGRYRADDILIPATSNAE